MTSTVKIVLKIIGYSLIYCLLNPILFFIFYKLYPRWFQVTYYWAILNLIAPIVPIIIVIISIVKSKNNPIKFRGYTYSLIYIIILYIGIIYFFTNGFKVNLIP
jgi:hypothetical protein